MSEAPPRRRHPETMAPDDFPEKEPHEYRCKACGAAEVPAEVWKDLVVGVLRMVPAIGGVWPTGGSEL